MALFSHTKHSGLVKHMMFQPFSSLPITSHLLRSSALWLHYVAWAQKNHSFTFKSTCQLIAVRNTFPRYRNHKNVFTFLLHFLIVVEISPLFHSDLLMLLMGIVSVLHEEEEGEIFSPNLVAVPSHQIHFQPPAFSRRNKPSTCPHTWRPSTLSPFLKLLNFPLSSYV